MAHVLMTFLGKGSVAEDAGSGRTQYRKARYQFPDGQRYETPHFGLALLQNLCGAGGVCVDRLVVLGTESSVWGALSENRIDDDLWVELDDRSRAGKVDQVLLNRVSTGVAESLRHTGLKGDVRLALIPFGRDEQEQISILCTMAECVGDGDRVSIDVSHGFRHLPMLGLLSALFLKSLKRVEIEGLYYGALEMRDGDGVAPVVRLDGLLRVAQWLGAMEVYRHTGDYGAFGPALHADGFPAGAVGDLTRASFLEKVQSVGEAKAALTKFRRALAVAPRGSVLDLFHAELEEKTGWVEAGSYAHRQLALAQEALHHRNYLRATLLGLEALISHRCAEQGEDPLDYIRRAVVGAAMKSEWRGIREDEADEKRRISYELNALRNAVGHGTRPSKGNLFGLQAVLSDEGRFRTRLDELLRGVSEILRPPGGTRG